MDECEVPFNELKTFLSTSLIFSKPISGEELLLYLSVSRNAISSVLVQVEGGSTNPFITLDDQEQLGIMIKKLT